VKRTNGLHGKFPRKNKNIFVQIQNERLLDGGITRERCALDTSL